MIKAKVRAVSKNGFRRAGIKFTQTEKEYELTPEQFKAVQAEKMLVCVVISDAPGNSKAYPDGEPEMKWKKDEIEAYLADKFGYVVPEKTDIDKADLLKKITELAAAGGSE